MVAFVVTTSVVTFGCGVGRTGTSAVIVVALTGAATVAGVVVTFVTLVVVTFSQIPEGHSIAGKGVAVVATSRVCAI